jgi:drug/metabolite transporter (DMT)-like permease
MYVWLAKNVGTSIAATEGYVTPAFATILGVLILNDPMTALGWLGAIIIVTSVLFIIRSEGRAEGPALELEEVATLKVEIPP